MAFLLRALSSQSFNSCSRFNCTSMLRALPSVPLINLVQERSTSFFNRHTSEQLWKGVTSVSNAGKKRGRGRGAGRIMSKDLNKGQIIGVGKVNMLWPGLTTPVIRGKELIEQQKLPEDPDREAKLLKVRNDMGVFRRLKLSPIERGWTGSKMPGRKLGPPDPVGESIFHGFETIALESKSVFNMTGNMGRKRRMSVFVVTGNQNGLAGFGLGKAVESRAAIKSAKNRAGQKLMLIPRHNDHTVVHDFFSQFGKTKVFVEKKPEGYGLKCHRAIKSICEVIGIKDLHAKIEGSTNLQHIVKAFFLGLLQQKSPEKMAEENQLHLVEIKKENDYFPEVIASPTTCLETVPEYPDFKQYVMGGRVVLQKKRFPPFYVGTKGYENHLKKTVWRRNLDDVKIQILSQYGELRSFLTEKYPEARPPQKKSPAQESE